MCEYVCIYMCVCMCVCLFIWLYVYVCVYMCIFMSIPKTLKMVLDASLLKTQHYKVRIKGKVEQSRERSSAPLHLCVVAIEKGAFWSPSTTVANLTYICKCIYICAYIHAYAYMYVYICECMHRCLRL